MDKRSVQDSLEGLTVGEVRAIEKRYGSGLDKLTGTEMTAGLVWAYERRRHLAGEIESRMEWPDVELWTMRQVNEYFAAEPDDVDDDDPESAEGKDDSNGA